MKKLIIPASVTILLMTASATTFAASVTIPNTFTSGAPAVAADVNANFNAVATSVNDNNSRVIISEGNITTNISDISTNTGNITTNSTAITNNAGNISTNSSAITSTAGGVTTNGNAITNNAGNITTNASGITTNGSAITTNAGNITTNGSAITTNTGNITTNTNAITTNAGNITTNTSNIATNVTDIATNVTNIATNVTNIATNVTDIANLQTAITCPTDMVEIGPLCVDTYEGSLWSAATAGTQLVANVGGNLNDTLSAYPCVTDGSDCGDPAANPIYARNVAGVLPNLQVTWYQAAQACANVGKRLPTTAEWQMAASGTPAGGDGVADCNSDSIIATLANTGATANCFSTAGAFDMVGNAMEWAADLDITVAAGNPTNTDSSLAWALGNSFNNNVAGLPTTTKAIFVLSSGPIAVNPQVGFRCVK